MSYLYCQEQILVLKNGEDMRGSLNIISQIRGSLPHLIQVWGDAARVVHGDSKIAVLSYHLYFLRRLGRIIQFAVSLDNKHSRLLCIHFEVKIF
jgi:hypothetical protein